MMASDNQSAERLLAAARELPPEHRSAFLDQACRDTPSLRRLVEELLRTSGLDGGSQETSLLRTGPAPGDTSSAANIGQQAPGGGPRFRQADVIANRFEVIRFIARGGMGEVYEVKDQFLPGVPLALKVLRAETASTAGSARRFEQEVMVARRVNHPNLCPIYDIFHCDQPSPPFSFLTMKLLLGQTLEDHIQTSENKESGNKGSDNLPAGDAVEICRQLLSGVAALHEGGILHRDLKPNNVMLERSGNRLLVSIMDFGLARPHTVESEAGASVTIAGTFGYMAPELLRGHPPSKASDIFALGIMIHQVLTGSRPGENRSSLSLVPSPALRTVQAPAHLVQAVSEFLSEVPEKRLRAFEQLQLAEGSQRPTSSTAFRSLRPKTIWSIATALLTLAVTWLAVSFSSRPVPHPLLSRQLTYSPLPKERPLLTDGSRLYFQSRGAPAATSTSGGMIVPLHNFEPGMVVRALSPDGSKLLAVKPDAGSLVNHGSLWLASSLGGSPRRVGSIVAQDVCWSPDGRSLVFADQRTVYSSDEDGTNQKKIWEAPGVVDSLGFSPDGRELTMAVITKENSRLWRVSLDGASARPILLDWPADSDQWYGQWTPNGKHYVFLSNREGAANVYEVVLPQWFEFWKKTTAVLITGNQIGIQGLALGRDSGSLYVLGQADQGAMQVLDPRTREFVPFLEGFPAVWFAISPDRQWMAYTEYPSGNLWKSRLDGSDAVQLTTTLGYMQAWSSDSRTLVYTDGPTLFLISAEGGTPEKLITASARVGNPTWAPDGKSILFSYSDDTGNSVDGIQVLDLATRKVSMMPGSAGLSAPSWSPNGKYLLAVARDPSWMRLYSAETKKWTELKNAGLPRGYWVWSTDSQSVYTRPYGNESGIFRLTIPGAKWEKMTGPESIRTTDRDGYPSLTIDGRLVIMSHSTVAQIYHLQWN